MRRAGCSKQSKDSASQGIDGTDVLVYNSSDFRESGCCRLRSTAEPGSHGAKQFFLRHGKAVGAVDVAGPQFNGIGPFIDV